MPIKRHVKIRAFALFLLFTSCTSAFSASTIDATQPAANGALTSSVIRNNFSAAANDINNILSSYYGPFPPPSPSIFQHWINTTTLPYVDNLWDGAQWIVGPQINPTTHQLVFPTTASAAGTNGQLQYNSGGLLTGFTVGGDGTLIPATGVLAITSLRNGLLLLPATSDTLVGRSTTDTLANKTLTSPVFSGVVSGNGTVPNSVLLNSTISGAALGSNLQTLTFGTHITGTGYNGSAPVTIGTDATSANTASTIVQRDASGNFVANSITASLVGLASQNLPLAGGTMSGAVLFGSSAAANTTRGSTGLNIDNLCQNGDSAYTIASTCRQVQTTAPFTAARTWTLPAANSVNGGQTVEIKDAAGGVSGTNTLTISRAGSDLINGATSQALNVAYAGAVFTSDGVSKWTYTAAASGGGGGVTSIVVGALLSAQSNGSPGGTITTTAPLDFANQTRGNLTLDRINLAKLLGAQRGVNTFADGWADTTGATVTGGTINTTPKTVTNTSSSYVSAGPANPTGNSGNWSGGYTVRQVITAAGISNTGYTGGSQAVFKSDTASTTIVAATICPGNTTGNLYACTSTPTSCLFSGAAGTTIAAGTTGTCTSTLNLVASTPYVISFYITSSSSLESSRTNYSAYYLSGNDTTTQAATGYTSYSYNVVSFLQLSALGGPNNITLTVNIQTADAAVTNARSGIVLNVAAGSITWGTSDTMEITCNGGTNWTAVTPVLTGAVQNGYLYETPDAPCGTSGTSFASRYKTLTNTNRTIYGLSTTVH